MGERLPATGDRLPIRVSMESGFAEAKRFTSACSGSVLLKDFSKPVVVANLIAWPLAFGAAQLYLNLFVQRISLSPVPFLISLIFTVFIAWLLLPVRRRGPRF